MDTEKVKNLVTKAQSGDSAAMNELLKACRKGLYYYAFKTVKDEQSAEDVTQDSMLEIFTTLGNLRDPAAFSPWAKRIVYHHCTRCFQKRKKEVQFDEDEDGEPLLDRIPDDDPGSLPEQVAEDKEFKKEIYALIEDLPPEQKEAVLLYYYEKRSVSEIARIQDVTEGTVKSRLNYARKALEKKITAYEKRTGVRLHGVFAAPILFRLIFGMDAASSSSAAAAGVAGTAGAAGAAAGVGAAAGAGASAAGAGTAAAGLSIGAKIAIGVTAAAIAGAGVTGAVIIANNEPAAVIETVETARMTDITAYLTTVYITTEAPQTEPKSTSKPETEEQTTGLPETTVASETTCEPETTGEPVTTGFITTEAPMTEPQTTEAPVTTKPPQTEPPVTDAPATDAPETDPPETEPPETEAPMPEYEPENASRGLDLQLNSAGDGYIVARLGECTDTEIIIPSAYNGIPVTAIRKGAFVNNKTMTAITIPGSIIDFGDQAFAQCYSLETVMILDGVTAIGAAAFKNCTGLTNVTLPDSLTDIGEEAFCSCSSLTEIEIPDGVTVIPYKAFENCRALARVRLSDNVVNIGQRAFYCCKLTDFTMPSNLRGVIGDSTFYRCDFTSVTIPDGVTDIISKAFANCFNLKKIELPETLKTIGDNVFSGCEKLETVFLPEGLEKIGGSAFYGCQSLTSINIPKSVTQLENGALGTHDYKGNPCTIKIVYYAGTEEEWNAIAGLSEAGLPEDVEIIFNYEP